MGENSPLLAYIVVLLFAVFLITPTAIAEDDTPTNDASPHSICITCDPGGGGGGSTESGVFSGAFLYFSRYVATIDPGQMPAVLDQLQSLGVDTVIVSHTRYLGSSDCPTSPSNFCWTAPFDPAKGNGLEALLSAADARNMHVYVGLTISMGFCGCDFWEDPNADAVVQDTATYTAYIYQHYGDHQSLTGWYIPDEPGQLNKPEQYDYYRRLRNVIKANGGYLPVAVAPYFGKFDPGPPDTVADNAAAFATNTGIDLQIWQDSIGTKTIPKLWPWVRNASTTAQYYQALSYALGRDGLWADVEIYNSSYDGTRTVPEIVLTPAALYRVNKQLYSTRFAAKRILWVPQIEAATPWGGNRAETAGRLYHSLLTLNGGPGHVWKPSSYYYSKAPSSSYPDDAHKKLFDHQPGDPENLHDPTWVGIYHSETLTVDLGSNRHIDWIGLELLTHPSWNIVAPMGMTISCSGDGVNYRTIESVSAPSKIAGIDLSKVEYYEYVLSNKSPLDADNCRYVRISIPNDKWTFISEVEISSDI